MMRALLPSRICAPSGPLCRVYRESLSAVCMPTNVQPLGTDNFCPYLLGGRARESLVKRQTDGDDGDVPTRVGVFEECTLQRLLA